MQIIFINISLNYKYNDMKIEYNLSYGLGTLTVIAGNFNEALEELNTKLGTSYTENQVRIKSAVRLS
jgi:hypothetical protein